MRLGFIGCGVITAAIVTGLRLAGFADPITLSPRNEKIAADLAARLPGVRAARDNQAVIDAADIVVIAVRPQIVTDVLPALRFRSDQQVVSLVATVSLDYLRAATAPAAQVTRAVPLPSVARRQCPIPIFPPNPAVKSLFDNVGMSIELDDESEFDVFTAATATMGSYFTFAGTLSTWMAREGVVADKAHRYVSEMLRGLAGAPDAAPDASFMTLAEDHQTRGGINEQVVRSLTGKGAFVALDQALDAVLKRLRDAHKPRA